MANILFYVVYGCTSELNEMGRNGEMVFSYTYGFTELM